MQSCVDVAHTGFAGAEASDVCVPAVAVRLPALLLLLLLCVLHSQDDGDRRREREEKRPVGYEDMKERYESLQKAYESLKAAHGEVCHV